FINVNDLEGDAPDIVKKGVKFLIRESLDQFDEFDTVIPATINSISRSTEESSDSETIKSKYRIYYDLGGSISKIDSIYNFDIVISSNNRSKKYSMTIPGLENKDSILKHQIDMLSEKIYKKIFPMKKGSLEIKPISSTYGKEWDKFESFFTGLGNYYKYEYMDAEKSFAGIEETPADKYYLANIYYFRGSRTLAKKKIKEIIPLLDYIIEPVKLKVLALNARLEFNFNNEIEYLSKLRERNILSKKTLFELGEAFFHHGNAEKAASFYSDALKLDSEFSSAINHLGYCYSYMGEHTRAIELFEEYRNLDNSANSFDSLGDGYFFSGELISSEASKKAAVRKDSKGVYWAYLTLSDIAILKARFSDARAAVKDYMKVTDSANDIGNAYSKL
ncbi:MAG: tetratricopeptide repeat protein, partial [Candidatus Aminicenantes bacterium]|nr:tetratricopeptide repeat protein [Candidatus Aminicenantes bacterium]